VARAQHEARYCRSQAETLPQSGSAATATHFNNENRDVQALQLRSPPRAAGCYGCSASGNAQRELVQSRLGENWRAQNTSIGKGPLDKEGQPDEIFERTPELLQSDLMFVRIVRRCIANAPPPVLPGWIIIVSGRRVSGKGRQIPLLR